MKYGVVIIFYNPNEDSIKRIRTYSENFDEVLVVDNSENEIMDIPYKLKQYKNCLYHKMDGNEGMAKALNYACYRAIDSKYDFLLTMDQDSIYTYDNIQNMKAHIEGNFDETVGIYSPNYSKLYFDEKKKDFVAAKPAIDKNGIKIVDFCMTSGSFINVKALNKVLPLENYFIAYVDNYLCASLIENNYKLLRVGSTFFAQQVGGVVKNNAFTRLFRVIHHTEVRYYYMVRNNLFLRNRFKHNHKLRIKSNVGLFRIIANILIGEENKYKKLKACIAGYRDFKRNVMGKVPFESLILYK